MLLDGGYSYEEKVIIYELIPKLVYLVSNYKMDYIPSLQLGETPPIIPCEEMKRIYTISDESTTRTLMIHFIMRNRIYENIGKDLVRIYDDIYALRSSNSIYKYYHFGKLRLEVMIQDLYTNPRLIINKAYLKLIKIQVMSWFPIGRRLTNIIHAKLLLNNMTLMHGAAILCPQNRATVFIAGAEVGKTSLVFDIALNNQIPLLAEDVFVTEGTRIYPCPYTTTYFKSETVLRLMLRHGLIKASKYRILKILNKLNRLDMLWKSILKEGTEVINYARSKLFVKEPYPIENIIVLVRGLKNEIKSLDVDEALHRVIMINRIEFDYFKDILISTYIGTFPTATISKIQDLMEREEGVVKQMLSNSKNLILIEFNSHEWLKNTVLKVLFKR